MKTTFEQKTVPAEFFYALARLVNSGKSPKIPFQMSEKENIIQAYLQRGVIFDKIEELLKVIDSGFSEDDKFEILRHIK